MTPLDGKKKAELLQQSVADEVKRLSGGIGRPPGLAVLLVGDNPASKIYVGSKKRAAEALGIYSRVITLPQTVDKQQLLECLWKQNDSPEIDAILVQLPLPSGLDQWDVIDQIHPQKDVDCFHPLNQGKLLLGRADYFPCTPAGILHLLDQYRIEPEGMNVAVVGRSLMVGKPVAVMLSARNATVTLCHSRSRDLAGILRRADMIVAAVGSPALVTADMVRDGVVLIDVGTNRIENEEECRGVCSPTMRERFKKNGHILVGDIHFSACEKSSYYTPMPGGVGPMTVAMLMHNTLLLYKKLNGLAL